MKRGYLLSVTLLCFATTIFGQSEFDCSRLDPIVATTEINMCEPGGKVTLEAQLNLGDEIYWYDSAESKDPIELGTSFDLKDVSSNTSYWVSEAKFAKMTLKGQAREKFKSIREEELTNNKALRFKAFKEFTIKEVDVIVTDTGGEITIELKQGLNVIESRSVTLPDASKSKIGILHTIPLNILVPGEGEYTLGVKESITLRKESLTENDFPIPIADVGEVIGGAGSDINPKWSTTYFWFYNWMIETEGVYCESKPRKEIKINVNADYPTPPKVEPIIILCGNANFTLEDVSIDANDLQWYDEFGDPLESDTVIKEGVVYNVAAVSPGGCRSSTESVSFVMQDLSDQPLAEVEQSFEEGSGNTLASLEVEGKNLQWYADANKEEELSEETELEDATTYYVTQTIENHCESEPLGITVSETLGMAEIAFEGLQYNNPITGILYLSNNEDFEDIRLYDIKGRQLSVNIVENSVNTINIDLSDFSPGIYLASFKVEGFRKTVQIVKE